MRAVGLAIALLVGPATGLQLRQILSRRAAIGGCIAAVPFAAEAVNPFDRGEVTVR